MIDMLQNRKGITPVIAIVLLLLVTVGAVGVVYTQFQNIADQGDTQFSTQARNTHVQIDSLAKSSGGDNITLVMTNRQDSVTIGNTTEMLQVSYKPNADSGYQSYSTIQATGGAGNLELSPNDDSDKSCFSGASLEPGTTHSCDLGVKWPNATQEFGIKVSVRGASNADDLDCTIETSESLSCS